MIILRDKRGGYQKQDYYTMYPDIEEKARTFSIAETSKKNLLFTIKILSQYITKLVESIEKITFL